MTEKTHFRKAFKSPYLSSADITGPTVLTIKHVRLEGDQSKKSKDQFNTAYFVEKELRPGEPLKPMILNVGNSKIMRDFSGSHWIDDWIDIKVTIFVDSNVRFGRDTVEGLRISAQAPKGKPRIKKGTGLYNRAKSAYARDKSFDVVLKHAEMSEELQDEIVKEFMNA